MHKNIVMFYTQTQQKSAEKLSALLFGAGDGNRTHATSLEGWDSTIELHPHINVDYYTTSFIFCQ